MAGRRTRGAFVVVAVAERAIGECRAGVRAMEWRARLRLVRGTVCVRCWERSRMADGSAWSCGALREAAWWRWRGRWVCVLKRRT